jgi:hypothetical protein
VRGSVVLADVRLDLDDSPDATVGVIADQVAAEKRAGGLEGGSDQSVARKGAPRCRQE